MSWLPSLFERKTPLLFDDLFDFLTEKKNGLWGNIAVDLQETPVEYIAKFNIPGVPKNKISVDLTNHLLTVSAQTDEEKEERENNYIIRQRRCGASQQSVSLPYAGSSDNVRAEYKDGVLVVNVKKNPEKQTKQIPIL